MFELNDGDEISFNVELRIEDLVAKLDGKPKQNAARIMLNRLVESFKIGV
jgi:hypothetical protein